MPNAAESAANSLSLIAAMQDRGIRAAAHHGRHLVWWGVSAGLLLVVQYFAEIRDWLPSRVLWWWQPPFLLGAAISLRALYHFPGGRPRGSAITRSYIAGFTAAFATLITYLLGSAIARGHPLPYTTVLVLTAVLGATFVGIGQAAGIRTLRWAGAGWWALLLWYAARGRLVPADFLVLAAAVVALVVGPGIALGRPVRTDRPRLMVDSTT